MATTNLNVNPYYDDFDEFKNFHQMLFKPGFAVQARELTQLQTILKNQIEKFGNHIFKQGSVVIPGNSIGDLGVPFIKLETQYGGVDIELDDFLDQKIVGATSNVEAVVIKTVGLEESDPITFYLNYTKGSSTGDVTFLSGEEIYLKDDSAVRANLQSSSATGVGSLAFILNPGVFYVNGTFVSVERQDTIMSKYDSNANCHVLLKINESIINSEQDTSLLDPAFGSYNYLAPGSDRLKISLELTTLPIDSAITSDYVELMRYRDGVLEEHAKTPKYNELDKILAQRTYEESGNYVIDGLTSEVREHARISTNGGVYANGNSQLLVVEVSPGKASVQGFSVEKLAKTRINVNKARTDDHVNTTTYDLRPNFGQYIVISDISGGTIAIRDRETVNLYNRSNIAHANASVIGTAKVMALDYLVGDPADALYKLWITDLSLNTSNTIENVGGIEFTSNASAYVLNQYNIPITSGGFTADELITHSSGRSGNIKYWASSTSTAYVHRDDDVLLPRVGDEVVGSSSNTVGTISSQTSIVSQTQPRLVFKLPVNVPKTLRDESNALDLSYTVQRELSITTDVSGNGSVSVSTGVIQPIEVGSFIALSTTGIVDNDLFSLNGPGTTLTLTGGPSSDVVKVYASVLLTDVSPKTKTATNNSETFTTQNTSYTLAKTDVYEINSITDDIVGDITNNFDLFDGQTEYAYTRSFIKLKDGRPTPTGNVTVDYDYYAHSISGDFFCVDSYSSVTDFLESNYRYISDNTGEVFNLAGCVDFRPSVGEDGTFTGTGSRRNDLIVNDTLFTSALQYYMPRIDSLAVNLDGALTVFGGVPSDVPYPPSIPEGQFEIYRFYIPEYTISAEDVSVKRMNVDRFTMKDIQELKNRVERVEKFVLLSQDENNLFNFEVVDETTGLSRFKTGYLVESFSEPLTIADTINTKFSSTFLNQTLQVPHEQLNCPLKLLSPFTGEDGFYNQNGYLMLKFDEVKFASQPLSSRVTNINPYLRFKWEGQLEVIPPNDTWVEVIDLPIIVANREETVFRTVWVPPPPPSVFRFNVPIEYLSWNIVANLNDTVTLTVPITGLVGTDQITVQETSRPTTFGASVDGVSATARVDYNLTAGQTRNIPLSLTLGTRGSFRGSFAILQRDGRGQDFRINWTAFVR